MTTIFQDPSRMAHEASVKVFDSLPNLKTQSPHSATSSTVRRISAIPHALAPTSVTTCQLMILIPVLPSANPIGVKLS